MKGSRLKEKRSLQPRIVASAFPLMTAADLEAVTAIESNLRRGQPDLASERGRRLAVRCRIGASGVCGCGRSCGEAELLKIAVGHYRRQG